MKTRVLTASLIAAGLVLSGCSSSGGVARGIDLARQVLPANDGWAAMGEGTTGGAKAAAANIYTVTNRAELVKALQAGGKPAEPKIILVKGRINLSVDDNNKELFEKDYADPSYTFDAYVKTYSPAVWNTKLASNKRPERKLSGPLEEARAKAAAKQADRIIVNLTSNTSIIGLGKDAKIVKGNLFIGSGTENVIIRNITFEDSFDYFPAWDPGDSWGVNAEYPGCQEAFVDAGTGPQKCPGGRWNSEYDNISINGGKRVWIDHCTFTDGDRPDKNFPPVFPFPHNQVEQKVQHHDGFVDITNGGDLVTLTYNHFKNHDKTSLIGGSDNSKIDEGKLNATFRANWFEDSGQRLPRVRFGKVHSYNNYVSGDASGLDPKRTALQNHEGAIKAARVTPILRSAYGVGKDSAIYSENNYFDVKNGGVEQVASIQGGTRFFDQGSIVNGQPADIGKALNTDPKRVFSAVVGWKPTLYGKQPIPAKDVPAHVKANAGAGKL